MAQIKEQSSQERWFQALHIAADRTATYSEGRAVGFLEVSRIVDLHFAEKGHADETWGWCRFSKVPKTKTAVSQPHYSCNVFSKIDHFSPKLTSPLLFSIVREEGLSTSEVESGREGERKREREKGKVQARERKTNAGTCLKQHILGHCSLLNCSESWFSSSLGPAQGFPVQSATTPGMISFHLMEQIVGRDGRMKRPMRQSSTMLLMLLITLGSAALGRNQPFKPTALRHAAGASNEIRDGSVISAIAVGGLHAALGGERVMAPSRAVLRLRGGKKGRKGKEEEEEESSEEDSTEQEDSEEVARKGKAAVRGRGKEGGRTRASKGGKEGGKEKFPRSVAYCEECTCLLYTSDAADDM
eukprot:165739-Rhodomonas_salina.3